MSNNDKDMERHASMALAAGLAIDTITTKGMKATADVLVTMDLDEARALAASAIRLAAAMVEAEATEYSDDFNGYADDDMPPAARVLGLFRRATQL